MGASEHRQNARRKSAHAMATASRPSLEEVCSLIAQNQPLEFRLSTELLFKILKNVLDAPAEPKYRSIKRCSKAFSENLAIAKGAVRFLRAVGWSEEGEADSATLVLPPSADLELLGRGKDALKALVKQRAAADAEARRVQDELSAEKLRELKRVSQQNTAKRDSAREKERQRLLEGIQIDRDDLVRQRDPNNIH